MKTKAFIIKLVMTMAILFLVLGLFFGVSLGDILLLGIILTIIGYVADFSIMPRIGGLSATAGDLILAFIVIYVYGLYGFDSDISVFSSAFLASMFIAAGEFYFHKYLIDHHHLLKEEMDENNALTPQKNMVPRAEFSEDFDKNLEKKSKES